MPRPPERRAGDTRYFLRFAGTASLLVAGTLVLVLYVLPQRYVLSSGFREGSLVLPTPSTPFEPLDARRIAALPLPVDSTVAFGGVVRGPAEVFWARVVPLLEAEKYREAIPLFATYLADWPDDRDVRREYALTLAAAGYGDRAVPVLEALLVTADDPEIRLVLARVLRDSGRPADADREYATLTTATPSDEGLWLERARALAWVEDWPSAEAVLLDALEAHPNSVPLRIELAGVWYATNRLEEARELLASIPEETLAANSALPLRDGVVAALTPPPAPEPEPAPPPTTLERAIGARLDGDLAGAETLFREALAERPEGVDAWLAWADFLQYERLDYPAALEALREVERLTGGGDPGLQYRMAQLELWTEDAAAARVRLNGLLAALPGPSPVREGEPRATRADVLTLLGDLDRWEGDRVAAVRRYEAALAEDPDHEGAHEGLRLVRAEAERAMLESEQPRVGTIAESLADTDDFLRLDLGGEWRGLRDTWVWGTRSGGRILQGRDLTGAEGDTQGAFAELEGARWWRVGTVRTALHAGAQSVRSGDVDLGVGASLRLAGRAGRRTDFRYDHEPAFGLTNTLQAVFADVRQDRVQASHTEPLGERWVAAVSLDAASLRQNAVASAGSNTRLGGGVSFGRTVRPSLTLGVAGRALRYADAAPRAGGLPLYWDPKLSVSVGPWVQYRRSLSAYWQLDARVNPGLAWIDERVGSSEVAPDMSGRLGLVREGAKLRTAVEVFYGQGRFSGYRSWGVNVAFGARLGASR